MRSIRTAALSAGLAAVTLAGVVTGPLDAQAAPARPAAAASCLHEHVSGKRRVERVPGSDVTVSVRSRACFDRVETWRSTGWDDSEYLSAERYLCRALGVEQDLHRVLGHGLLTAVPVVRSGFVGGKSCLWTLPYARFRTPTAVVFEGVQVQVIGDANGSRATYDEYVDYADVPDATLTPTRVAGREAVRVRFGADSAWRHQTRLIVRGPASTTVIVTEQTSDEHPALRKALRHRLLRVAVRAVAVAKTLNTGPLE